MGFLGRKSIEITLAKFSQYWIENFDERSTIKISLGDQLGNLCGLFDFDYTEYKKSKEGVAELLMDIAVRISSKEAKKMATTNINIGLQLEKSTGSETFYFPYAIFGAYYQSIYEANILNNLKKSAVKQVHDMMPLVKTSKLIASIIYEN